MKSVLVPTRGSRRDGEPPPQLRRYGFECSNRPPLGKESWTKNAKSQIVKYSLAYIDFSLYSGDNGRVLGYDNAHGFHERHFMGKSEQIAFTTYNGGEPRHRRTPKDWGALHSLCV